MQRSTYATLTVAALLMGAFAAWPSQMFGTINYDAALAVQRSCAMAVAASQHMTLVGVTISSFLWYGGWVGICAFETGMHDRRVRLGEELKSLLRPIWSRTFGPIVGWIKSRRPASDRVGIVARVIRWTERQHWGVQLLVLLAAALSINGMMICIAIMDGWDSQRVRWQFKALMLGVTNTAACLIWQLVLGGQVRAASGVFSVVIVGCEVLMYGIIVILAVKWLRGRFDRLPRLSYGWRPAWSRSRA